MPTTAMIGEVWIVEIGEPLPDEKLHTRLMRAGQIARRLAARGQKVRWWVSEYSHSRKAKENQKSVVHILKENYGIEVEFLRAVCYKSNRSPLRLLNNIRLSRNFAQRIRRMAPPKAIFCCYPLPSLANACTRYAREHGSFCLIDIRDLWPDAMFRVLPPPFRLALRLLMPLLRGTTRQILEKASALTILAPGYKSWVHLYTDQPAPIRVVPLSYDPPTDDNGKSGVRDQVSRALAYRRQLELAIVGNISRVPRFDMLVLALNALSPEEQASVRVLICGSGEALPWLTEQTVGLPVELLGFCGAQEIAAVLKHSDAGLLLYPDEADFHLNYPNKVGEYLAFGLPIISSLSGAVGDLIAAHDIGWNVKSSEDLTEVIRTLLVKPAMYRQKNRACSTVFNATFNAEIQYETVVSWLSQGKMQ